MLFETPRLLKESSAGFADRRIIDEMFVSRGVILLDEINSDRANSIILQLLYLQNDDPDKEIVVYIDSPGGGVHAGLAIYDVMEAISCPIRCVCMGTAASMGALLFLAGDTREILKHSRVMLHDPSRQNLGGTATEINDEAKHIMKIRDTLARIIAKHTGQTLKKVLSTTSKDTWFDSEEAVSWGLADRVLETIPPTT